MRSKRLFAILLAFCLVFSNLAPAASAVEAPEDSVVNAEQNPVEGVAATAPTASPFENDLIVSGDDTTSGALNMRDDPLMKKEANNDKESNWVATPTEKPSASLTSETPAYIEELQKAAEMYSRDEVVSAFVVMEDQPLAESYSSISQISVQAEKQLIEKQNNVISAIEKNVLGGKKLEVRYQFTYLTNSFSIRTEFANLVKIAEMDGVKSVFLTPIYNAVPTEPGVAGPQTANSGSMTGVDTVWEDLGYTGQGMKIAIIDTGLDLDHPSFAAAPEGADMTAADIAAVLEDLNAYDMMSGDLEAEDLYYSEKVPYAFNYVDRNLNADHSRDSQGDHGTHVAGIAAANATEGTTVVGMAPDAQIIVMKVFGAAGGAYTDDFVAAIEDAMTLGCDVVNLSLGSPAGFTSTDTEIDLIFERLASQDIIATISAGNETDSAYGNMWGTNLNRTQNPENGVVGSPSTYVNAFSIASAENGIVMSPYISLGDTKIFYQDSVEALYGYVYDFNTLYAGEDLEYVIIDGLGAYEDFYDADGNSLVYEKIAVVLRGELSFSEKVNNASSAGAAACIIWNNNDDDDIFTFGMTTEAEDGSYPTIPSILITLSDGQKLADAETKVLHVAEELGERQAQGGQMSSFSSWGTTSDLRLVPDITGIGGNVYSCYDGGQYGLMSGTSMSAPQIAGISALVMQYLKNVYPNATDGEIRELALALMMSTADPVISTTSGVEASPRQQGAGLVDAAEATQSDAYLTVGGDRPKVELGDSASGTFTFSFEIHNISDEDKTYTLDASLLSEAVTSDGTNLYMAGYDWELSGSVSFDKETVTVPAGGRSAVTATVELSDDDKAMFEAYWPNGGYVEGYVYLYNAEGEAELNLPYMGFYGDWTEAPVFDTAYWYDNSFFSYDTPDGMPEGDQYYNAIWTTLDGTDWVLGLNPYSGALLGEDGKVIYDPANNAVSPNGDGLIDGIDEIYLSLLRNVKALTFTYTVDGEVVHQETVTNNMKTMYISAYGQIVPWIGSWYLWEMYDFTDAEGNVLPNGTEVLLTIDAKIDYGTGGTNTIEIPFVVDVEAPALEAVYEAPQEDGSNWLVMEISENHSPAAVMLLNASGTRILNGAYDVQMEKLENGNYAVYMDITGLGTEFTVAVADYAANEVYYTVEYTADPDGNLPEMDTSLLYAYRTNDTLIGSLYGYDYMFGWVSLDKPENTEDGYSWINELSSDYMEMYALTAAEYAGGKIFAVDAGYNFLVMDPGLWNRTTICNLGEGFEVLDMAFDDSTDTMYMLVQVDDYYTYLYTIDLMSGDVTALKDYGSYYYAPWVLTAADDGTIYAAKYSYSSGTEANLYILDKDNDYELTAVTDENGDPIAFFDSNGSNLVPNYLQSMTYADGIIYWAYFYGGWAGNSAELIAIDTNNGYAATNVPYAAYDSNYGAYQADAELVGLITLDETDYEIPEATELEGIWMDTEHTVIGVGEKVEVSANPVPWNFELGDLVWTSSDESIATVVDGVVTGVSEGNVEITVAYGDLTASCSVTVVNVEGNFYAYNYYSADSWGDFINVDMAEMSIESLGNSPVDFIAGDYNGHDGYFYGYTEGGQLFKLDMTTGQATALGSATGINPTDMAYDYSTGYMYALYLNDYGYGTLGYVNMNNGEITELAVDYAFTSNILAIDLEGNMYSITAAGELLKLSVVEYEDWWSGEMVTSLEGEVLMEGLGYLQYQQSMCYDHANDVILWTNPEMSTVYWIDFKNENPYVISLGDPSGSGLIEWLGMFTIPETIPELAPVAVESVSVEDMFMMVGAEAQPNISILPLNANDYTTSLTSADETIVSVKANGSLKALAEGETDVTLTVVDNVAGETTTLTFHVTVALGADNLYGHVMTDIATMGGSYWIELPVIDPKNPTPLVGTSYVVYAEEYYNGKIYAVGYDANDWEANWQLMVLDPVTFDVESMTDLGEGFPFVYDMTYDYNTSTMYAVAGVGSNASDLYALDLETGELILLMETEQFFISLAAGPEGLYAIAYSEMVGDMWDPWAPAEYDGAMMYLIDPIAQTIDEIGNTGVIHNSVGSMTYDYDTDYLYWVPLNQDDYTGGLAIVDPATGEATVLGSVGALGAQVSGLYVICDEYPEENPELHEVFVAPSKAVINVGATTELAAVTLSMGLDAEIVWTSSNNSVATVENGVVTGVSQGSAVITATATYGGVTKSATCEVGVLAADASFLTYNVTDAGWASISRADSTVVTNLTEGVDESAVTALAANGTTVYGVDEENNLFTLNTETYERTVLATFDAEAAIAEYMESMGETEYDPAAYGFTIRDLAYDSANDRLLALGSVYDVEWGEINSGCSIYEVNLTTGALTRLHQIVTIYNVMAMAVDGDGMVYYYNAYDDYYSKLDLTTGIATDIVSLQTQTIYGDYESGHELYYDELTGMLYHLFTSNGSYYRMIEIDPATGAFTVVGNVGEVVYNSAAWRYDGDTFSGLVFVNENAEEPVYEANIVSANVALNGSLNLAFYATLSDDVLAAEDVCMKFAVAGKTISVPLSEAQISEKNGVTRYMFAIEMAAKQMADEVVAQVYVNDQAVGEAKSYSIQKFAEAKINKNADAELVALAKAMLNYGAAAQVFFDYNVENLANANLSDAEKVLADVDASAYAHSITGSEDGIKAKGASLEISSLTTIRITFTLTGDKTIDAYTFTVDGVEVTPVASGNGTYYVDIPDIGAKNLDDTHVVKVGGLTVNYSGLSYVNQVLKNANASEAKQNAAKALYVYNQAANAFFE